jgi:hypothetical protein
MKNGKFLKNIEQGHMHLVFAKAYGLVIFYLILNCIPVFRFQLWSSPFYKGERSVLYGT